MNEWCLIILGCAMGVVFSTIAFFCIIQQNDNLQKEVAQLREEVAEHEKIMRAYEWFNWNATLKMDTEDLEK